MPQTPPEIKLYGANSCHKSFYYKKILDDLEVPYTYMCVEENQDHADELRSLYVNKKLNFPTITIGKKKLRNPYKDVLIKWINKLIPQRLNIVHDKENQLFTLDINGDLAKVEYTLEDRKMSLVYSEVPYYLRGQGVGKVLVEKTFEKLTQENYTAVAVCNFIKAVRNQSDKWSSIIE